MSDHGRTWVPIEDLRSARAEVERLRAVIASAAISLATGPTRDDYAYRVLTEALDA